MKAYIFYYFNTVLPMPEIRVSQIISFQSLSSAGQMLIEHFRFPHFFVTFFFWGIGYIYFKTISKTQMIQVPFSFAYQKAAIGQNTSVTEKQAVLKSQLLLICDTDLLDDVFNSKGVPWQHK